MGKKNLFGFVRDVFNPTPPREAEHDPTKRVTETITDHRESFRLNRFLSNNRTILAIAVAIPIFAYLIGNYVYWALADGVPSMLHGEGFNVSLLQAFVLPFEPVYIVILLAVVIFFEIKIPLHLRTAYKDFTVQQKGSERWATIDELRSQYRAVPEKDTSFEGKGGVPVAWDRERNQILIDDSAVHNYVVGTTRSGKGESYIFPLIDIYSRASEKASLIVCDPKLEQFKMSAQTLKERGYKVCVLNLASPDKSMGFNPLTAIVDAWRVKDYDTADELVSSFCTAIYKMGLQSGGGDNVMWYDLAENLLAAMILAHVSDCVELDEQLNKAGEQQFAERKKMFESMTKEEQEGIRNYLANLSHEEIVSQYELPVEPEREWIPVRKYQKQVTPYSVVSVFSTLASQAGKKNKSALDTYFEKRPILDRARLRYAATALSEGKGKASIYITMLSKIQIFTRESIAKMTANSSLNFLDIGFDPDKNPPHAIFLSMPDFDSSNHYIATLFIQQLYSVLAKECVTNESRHGRCDRDVVFVLDEVGNMPKIAEMKNYVTVGAGRGLRMNLIVQSNSQLYSTYGESDARTIIGNCGNRYFLSSADLETRKTFADDIGSKTIISLSRTGQKLDIDKSYTELVESRHLLDYNELAHLHEGENVVLRIMQRHDLEGNDIKSVPIFNTGNTRFKYRYQYLRDTFPNLEDIDNNTLPYVSNKGLNLKEYVYNINEHFMRLGIQEHNKKTAVIQAASQAARARAEAHIGSERG